MAKKKQSNNPDGRKTLPEPEKKIQIGIYIRKSQVEDLGGVESVRQLMRTQLKIQD